MGVVETPAWSREMLGCVGHHEVFEDIPPDTVVEISRITQDGILEGISDECGELHFRVMDLENAREEISEDSRPLSWLVPLLEAWITTEPGRRPTDPERRIRRIMPEPIRDAVPSRTQVLASTGARSPQLARQPNGAGYLPGLEPPPVVVVPVLPLDVAEVATTGAAAPIVLRLWFGCQMALSLDRRAGDNEVLLFTLREVRDWLWPNSWNRRRDLPRLIEGLRNLATMGIIWARREWILVRPILIPTMDTRLDDYLLVEVTALPGSDRGPMIDTKALWGLGAKGAVPLANVDTASLSLGQRQAQERRASHPRHQTRGTERPRWGDSQQERGASADKGR